MSSFDRTVGALALATAAFVSMPLGALTGEARAETPEEARRRVLRRIPEGLPAPRVVTRVEPAEYVRVCDAYGSGFYYIPGTDTCLRIGGYVRYEVNSASSLDPVETSTPEPADYVRICDAFGARFYYIPGTDTCLRVGGYVRTTVYDASRYQYDGNGEDDTANGPSDLFDYDFFVNGSVGRASGFSNPFLATELAGQLTLGVIDYKPEGTSTGVEVGGQFTVGEFGSGFLRQGMFLRWGISHSVFNDSESLGTFNAGAGTGLGIPGTGDPNANNPAGVLLAPPNTATNINGRFDWSATGINFAFGRELVISPMVSIAPFGGFEWMKINERVQFSFSVPNYPLDVAYDTGLDITRKSLVAGSEFNWSPGYAFGPVEIGYFFTPTFYWDCLDFSGTDRLALSGILNDNQSVDFDGGDGALGGALRVGLDIEFENSPIELYIGAGYERRAAGVAVVRTGQTGDMSSGNVEYQSNFSLSVGAALTY
jgi:hypothetical protein